MSKSCALRRNGLLKRRGKSLLAFDPTTVVIKSLPSVLFAERGDLPNAPGIYFVLDAEKTVQYIGRAKRLCFRWQNHHRWQDFHRVTGISIAYLHVTDPALLPEIEAAMITYFDPPLNRERKPGPISKGYKASPVQLPPDLLEWAKAQEEGLAGLCRRLLSDERKRREKASRRP
jgi:hypothetical protein